MHVQSLLPVFSHLEKSREQTRIYPYPTEAFSSIITFSFISCIIFKTCRITGLCSGDVTLNTVATSTSIPSLLSSSSSSLIALTNPAFH
ncbi:UBC core domain-containing protein [Psidium guajava]|nr:UBC core domain-containing protein [Psidium guajava]